MPRMNGLEAAQAIRALPGHPQTPIIALTANAFVGDRERCLAAGMNGHVSKPVTTAVLAEVLGQWLFDAAAAASQVSQSSQASPRVDPAQALLQIPGLDIDAGWRSSPEEIAYYRSLLDKFIATNVDEMTRLRAHLAAGDQAAARACAHDLKGIAGLVGARRVSALANEIVQCLQEAAAEPVILYLADQCAAELQRLAATVAQLPPAS